VISLWVCSPEGELGWTNLRFEGEDEDALAELTVAALREADWEVTVSEKDL
jgi:hypothetical protein